MISKSSFSFWREFYWGEWNKLGQIENFGIKISTNGNFYIGTFKENKMDGMGIYLFADKSRNIFDQKKLTKESYLKNMVKYNKDIADLKLYETVIFAF